MKINNSNLKRKIADYVSSDKFKQTVSSTSIVNMRKRNHIYGWTIQEIETEILRIKRIIYMASKKLTKENVNYVSSYRDESTSFPSAGLRWENVTPDILLRHKIYNIQRSKTDSELITSCRIALSFNQDVVRSPSLFEQNQGVDNILRLLTNGWDFRGSSHRRKLQGTWFVGSTKRGNVSDSNAIPGVYAKRYRRPDTRLFDAIDNYNNKTNGRIFVTLNNTYISAQSIGNIRFGI